MFQKKWKAMMLRAMKRHEKSNCESGNQKAQGKNQNCERKKEDRGGERKEINKTI